MVDETELLRRARSLDEDALGTIFDTYYPLVYRYIYHHVRHEQTAEDLGAEVFERLVSEIGRGRGPTRNLVGWMYRVAHNLVIDDARAYAYRNHEQLAEAPVNEDTDVETRADDAVRYDRACQALAALTPNQRTVIVLRYMEGLENAEVARLLDVPVSAVKSRLRRGLAATRRYLVRTNRSRAK